MTQLGLVNGKTPPLVLQGQVHVLLDTKGHIYADIDTDMIFHNAHLAITDIEQMGQYALGNLEGWEDFPARAKEGDIVIAGGNFGAGSSRQQAVDCFRSLGIVCLLAESFGAIYWRNAVNSGFPVLACPDLLGAGQGNPLSFSSGDTLQVNLETGDLENISRGCGLGTAKPFSNVQKGIYLAGNLFGYKV